MEGYLRQYDIPICQNPEENYSKRNNLSAYRGSAFASLYNCSSFSYFHKGRLNSRRRSGVSKVAIKARSLLYLCRYIFCSRIFLWRKFIIFFRSYGYKVLKINVTLIQNEEKVDRLFQAICNRQATSNVA